MPSPGDLGVLSGLNLVTAARVLGKRMSVAAFGDSLIVKGNASGYDMFVYTQAQMYQVIARALGHQSFLAQGAMRSGGSWFPHEFNPGFSGATSATILSTVLPCFLQQPYALPDCCVVLAGTNDPAANMTLAQVKANVLTALANITAMWTALQNAGVQPIAMTIPPKTGGNNAGVFEAYAAELAHAVVKAAQKAGIPCADVYTAMIDIGTGFLQLPYQGLSTNTPGGPDGTHPSPLGFAMMGYVLNQTMQGAFGAYKPPMMPTLIDTSAVNYSRDPGLLGISGTINTLGSFPNTTFGLFGGTGNTYSTVYNASGTEPGIGHTMRQASPGVFGQPVVYEGNSWGFSGTGGASVFNFGQFPYPFTGNLPSIGDRLAFAYRIKQVPLATAGFKVKAYGSQCTATGTVLTVGGKVSGTFAIGDTVFINGQSALTTIASLGTGTGGAGTYNLTATVGTIAAATQCSTSAQTGNCLDSRIVTIDANNNNLFGLTGPLSVPAQNMAQPQIGNETNYVAGEFYMEYTLSVWNTQLSPATGLTGSLSGLTPQWFATTDGGTAAPNTGDSVTIANISLVDLTLQGIA